jgi:hypothetical protein
MKQNSKLNRTDYIEICVAEKTWSDSINKELMNGLVYGAHPVPE